MFLTLLEINHNVDVASLQEFVLAASNNIFGFKGTFHVLQPNLVVGGEEFSFSWQVSGDITGGKDRD